MKFAIGDHVKISEGSGCDSGQTGIIVPLSEVGTDSRGVPKIPGNYKPLYEDEYVIKLDNPGYQEYTSMFANRLTKI